MHVRLCVNGVEILSQELQGLLSNINSTLILWSHLIIIILLLSVYGAFSDRVGLPLRNIPYQFLSGMGIFFVDLKFFHIRFYTLYHVLLYLPTGLLHSTLNILHPIIITFAHYMSIPFQTTTSNNGCDRLNSNHPSHVFICPSVFHGDTTHLSNHLHIKCVCI